MSASSYQLIRDTVRYEECEAVDDETGEECTFGGLVEGWSDPERFQRGWTCPSCGRDYEIDIDEFDGWDE